MAATQILFVLGAALWLFGMTLIIGLCRAAARGDRELDRAHARMVAAPRVPADLDGDA
jgi:hypothetical protein